MATLTRSTARSLFLQPGPSSASRPAGSPTTHGTHQQPTLHDHRVPCKLCGLADQSWSRGVSNMVVPVVPSRWYQQPPNPKKNQENHPRVARWKPFWELFLDINRFTDHHSFGQTPVKVSLSRTLGSLLRWIAALAYASPSPPANGARAPTSPTQAQHQHPHHLRVSTAGPPPSLVALPAMWIAAPVSAFP